MTTWLWDLALAMGVYWASVWPPVWSVWAAGAAGLALRAPGIAVGGMLTGAALELFRRHQATLRERDRQDGELEAFLHALVHAERSAPSAQAALDVVVNRIGVRAVEPEQALSRLAARWPEGAFPRGRSALLTVLRHGGRLAPVLEGMLLQLRQDRRVRWDLESQLAGPRMTLVLLTAAPWGLLALFRVMLPGFYAVLTTTVIGNAALVWCGVSALVLHWTVGREGGIPRV